MRGQRTVTASNNVTVDGNRYLVDDGHCNGGQRPLWLLATAAVMVGNSSCNNRQRLLLQWRLQQQGTAAKAAAKTVDSRFLNDG